MDIPLAHVSLSIPFGLDDPNIFRACFGHIKSLVPACLFIVSWWSILILPMWYDLVLQNCWCITPVKPGLDAQRLLHVHCLHAAVWHPWCGELWPREQDVAYQHWLKCVGKMEHVYACLISIYIYPYHEELAGLCSTMGCWHVSTDKRESHRWAGIVDVSQLIHHFITTNYLEGIWSHHNITIISRWIFGH
jgi:hypothetical protein